MNIEGSSFDTKAFDAQRNRPAGPHRVGLVGHFQLVFGESFFAVKPLGGFRADDRGIQRLAILQGTELSWAPNPIP